MDALEILEKLAERTDFTFEVIEGKIVPKECSEPLPDEVLRFLLADNFSFEELINFYEIPMASINHSRIISQLTVLIAQQISGSGYGFYINGIKVAKKSFGTFYVPDLAFTLRHNEIFDCNDSLENPVSIIEVLSPSTEKKDRNEKAEAYKSIESLQEYVLIAQDPYKIEQYLRKGKTTWTVKIYDSENDTCILTVGVKIKLNELYQNTDWANQ
jgi:Uma2 family endonuclease